MKAVFPLLTLCGIVLILFAFLWYFSPMAEVSELRTENNALRDTLAAQNGNESELIAVVITGFLAVMIICFAFFFLVLCFLAGKTPVEFFRLPAFLSHPPEIPRQVPEHVTISTPATVCPVNYPENQYVSVWEVR